MMISTKLVGKEPSIFSPLLYIFYIKARSRAIGNLLLLNIFFVILNSGIVNFRKLLLLSSTRKKK